MVVDEKDLSVVLEYGAQKYKEREKEDLFLDYLISRNMWLQPGCYMIRMKAFIKANPDRFIYPSRAGLDRDGRLVSRLLLGYRQIIAAIEIGREVMLPVIRAQSAPDTVLVQNVQGIAVNVANRGQL